MEKRRKHIRTFTILAVLLVAAVFLVRWGHRHLLETMYPRTYSDIVTAQASENNLDPNLVYAVIRQESKFQADAESGAGAVGLMQLTPDTFDWLQQREGAQTKMEAGMLTDPEVNVHYGCRFLSFLVKRYGVLHTALCAYNAGMNRVDGWLENTSLSKDGKNLDSVPYDETRSYAEKVLANYKQYKALYAQNQ